ncbi:unnamed protein product [Caenorhabditis brenneri]
MSDNKLPTFPLLQLPIEAQKHVVRLMEKLHQLTLSTFNDNTKQLVTSSGLTCKHFYVSLFPTIKMTIQFCVDSVINLEFETELIDDEYRRLNQSAITARYDTRLENPDNDEVHVWNKESFVVRDWIQYFLRVLNRSHIDSVLNCPFFYEAMAIQRTFETFTVHRLQTGLFSMHILTLLENLPPVNHVDFSEPIADEEFRKILVQNYDALVPYESQKITLDHLLLCNCAHLETSYRGLTSKDLNQFLKIWINSTLCSRLRYLQVNLWPKPNNDHNDFTQVMKDINYQTSNENRVFEFFREYRRLPTPRNVFRGMNINRMDGTEATIVLPIEAQKHVIRLMDRLHQLTLSTFTDNTKQLVTSSGITCDYFTVSLFPTTRITIRFVGAIISLEFEEGESHDYKELNQSSITAKYGIYLKGPDQDEVHVLDKKRFVVRDWIKHLLQVLNRTRIDAVFNCNASYQTNAILRTFKTFTVHRVRTGFRSMSILTLLENLPPVCRVDFSEPIADEEFSKILAQNYGGLSPDVSQKITLNHLLSCNCVYLNISNHDLTTKDLNRFLKIWTNSTLCTRLVYLQVNLSP